MHGGEPFDPDLELRALVAEGYELLGDESPAIAATVFERAILKSGHRAVEAAGRAMQRVTLADAVVGLAQSYVRIGRGTDALTLARQAEHQICELVSSVGQRTELERLQRRCSRAIAGAHQALGQHQLATDRYQQLIRSFRRVVVEGGSEADDAELSRVLEEAATSALALGRTEAAIDALTGAIKRWRRLCSGDDAPVEHRRRLIRCLRALAEIETGRGNSRDGEALRAEADIVKATLPPGSLDPDQSAITPEPDVSDDQPIDDILDDPPTPIARARSTYGRLIDVTRTLLGRFR